MTSDLIERVARAIANTTDFDGDRMASRYADSELRDIAQSAITAVIEADREAVRAEQAAELAKLKERLEINPEFPAYDGIACRDETIRLLDAQVAKWKALAETLSVALEQVADYGDIAAVRIARQALTSYKEQRDAS